MNLRLLPFATAAVLIASCAIGCGQSPAASTAANAAPLSTDTTHSDCTPVETASLGADAGFCPSATAPCGHKVGETLCDVSFQGYLTDKIDELATTANFVDDATLNMASSLLPRNYAVVLVGAWW